MAPSVSLDGENLPSIIKNNDVTDSPPHDHADSTATTTKHYSPENHTDLSRDTCDPRRRQEPDKSRLVKMQSELVGKTVSPFLKEHIPGLYAPVGKDFHESTSETGALARSKEGNTRFCYRHRPDSKCRRAADETKMGLIQRVSLHMTGWHCVIYKLTF